MLDPHQRIAARQLYRSIARLARDAKVDLREPGMIRNIIQGRKLETEARPETLESLRNMLLLLGQELAGGSVDNTPPPIKLRSGTHTAG